MIKKIQVFTYCCDGCGVSTDQGGEELWIDEQDAIQAALDLDWEKIGGGIYCPFCIELNDKNEFVVKPKP
jgi:hypothetical protein